MMRCSESLGWPVVCCALIGLLTLTGIDVKDLPPPNYDESKVPQYTLPDPLVMRSGEKVTTREQWQGKRRAEVLELFREHVYGRMPQRPARVRARQFESADDALGGKARRAQVSIDLTDRTDGPQMDLLLYLPAKARGPAPVFLLLNFEGNHAISTDPAIRMSTSWMAPWRKGIVNNRSTEETRGATAASYPVEKIIERGYGLATIYYGDIDPDFDDNFANGVHGALDKPSDKRPGDAWGSIAAWAWGLRQALDYLETRPDVDAKRVALLGHSRLGKTALWAGAEDERFALVISNNSGCGGAALSRRCFGETVQAINVRFPHWFCDNFTRYNEREHELPVDQHMLIALIAPRPVYVASAEEDRWADPKGEFLGAKHAEPVYRLFGLKGLGVEEMPPLNQPVGETIGYHIRSGKHALDVYDWEQYLNFADRHLGGKGAGGR